MKLYFAFKFLPYYPFGGAEDLIGVFRTREEAEVAVHRDEWDRDNNILEVDTKTLKAVVL